MKIAVTSRSFSKNQILRNSLLQKYPESEHDVKFNDEGLSLTGSELIEFLGGIEKVIIGLEKMQDSILLQLPDLKVISKYGVGLDNIDVPALTKNNIQLGWSSGVNKRSVAELTLFMAIGCLRKAFESNQVAKQDSWKQIIGNQLTGKTYGIIGLGNVGKDLALLLKPFGCKIISYDIKYDDSFCAENNITKVSFQDVLSQSDIVSVHVPKEESTLKMIAEPELKNMKQSAILINTARGGIVCEDSLLNALSNNTIAGAALDVLDVEPPVNNPLIQHPSVFVTTHIGGSAQEAVLAMGEAAIHGLDNFIDMADV